MKPDLYFQISEYRNQQPMTDPFQGSVKMRLLQALVDTDLPAVYRNLFLLSMIDPCDDGVRLAQQVRGVAVAAGLWSEDDDPQLYEELDTLIRQQEQHRRLTGTLGALIGHRGNDSDGDGLDGFLSSVPVRQ